MNAQGRFRTTLFATHLYLARAVFPDAHILMVGVQQNLQVR
jgi:hypothetical protein